MAPRLFSIILNVSPWFGRMTFYWSGPAMAFSPLCMRVFPSRDEVSPERTWEKNRCLRESSLLWPLENNGGGGKIRQMLLFDSGQEQVIENGDVACIGDWALQESFQNRENSKVFIHEGIYLSLYIYIYIVFAWAAFMNLMD